MSQFNVRPEVKAEYLAQRLDQLNSEGWAHEMNRATSEAVGDTDGIAKAEEAIAIILTAIAVVESQQTPVEEI